MKKHNFSAGPAILPPSVIKQAAQAVENFNDLGLSILEVSHRGADFVAVLDEAIQSTKDLLGLGDEFEVLFLTGGASTQFFMSAMNLLGQDELACYVDTGTWSTKAIKEAKLFGNVEVLASSKEANFNYIPKGYSIPSNAKYLHLTSNNTIYGTQHQELPATDTPIICDMSSDIFSRPIDPKRYAMIYAGAQKNLGPAGTTLVIIRKEILGKIDRAIPTMLDYSTHINKNSSFNTPPVYPIYVCMLTMRWLKEMGGVEAMQKHNEEKAAMLYGEIDRNPLFSGTAAVEDRSLMNVCFTMSKPELEKDFMDICTAAGCSGIKGHRSVGGFRASIYNAMPKESIEVLVNLMKKFAEEHA
ncbi:MAG: 3-phosphoserine/phosphohydroxythreonine transaminase [Saprospiraceae bacterium]